MDWTPLIPALIALLVKTVVGLAVSNRWLLGALSCNWWLVREHTQAD